MLLFITFIGFSSVLYLNPFAVEVNENISRLVSSFSLSLLLFLFRMRFSLLQPQSKPIVEIDFYIHVAKY